LIVPHPSFCNIKNDAGAIKLIIAAVIAALASRAGIHTFIVATKTVESTVHRHRKIVVSESFALATPSLRGWEAQGYYWGGS
jgi:hypothetical protein